MTDKTKKSAHSFGDATTTLGTTMTAQTDQMIALTKANLEKMAGHSRVAMERTMKTVDTLSDVTKGNLEAILESSQIASTAFQSLTQESAEYSKQSLQRAAAATQAMMQVQSVTEFLMVQREYAMTELAIGMAEIAKVSQAMFTNMTAIYEPLLKRASSAMASKD
ncbi:hypothetical protein PbB2_01465 [Candidatus Phycosocius bacilliformis]|uniref:Phasin domain-containing protein n=1 Tax=Candidatus Phycosocius bacilliformis TaxID=1445552 RepID=A0A2P2E9Q9_9PROT|nr:phasin family protein [Candidatus Phycosocius bacilliformis]GBF57795.1 hypothetical protein PbB2_01465 [Candidatus Phycosocius bacilliformis]